MSDMPQGGAAAVTVPAIRDGKGRERITAVTAFDYPSARLADEAGIDIILVGDSLGPCVLGLPSTLPVSLEQMIAAAAAVTRGVSRALVVGDLPFGSYHESAAQAVRSSVRFVKEGGVAAVKMEGGVERARTIRRVVDCGVPVMAHIGLRPQAMHAMGGYKVQGRGAAAAARLAEDAAAVAEAGAFSLVIEGVPEAVGAELTRQVRIPTIGIGAGAATDGQILVFTDLVGLNFGKAPRFVRRYADARTLLGEALQTFRDDVRAGRFPAPEESY